MAVLLLAALQIDEAIRELGSERLEEREAATLRLLEIGEPAVPALERASTGGDPEVRMRADAILRRLARDRKIRDAVAAARPRKLNLISIDARIDPDKAILHDINRLAGRRFAFSGETHAVLSIRADDAPVGEFLERMGWLSPDDITWTRRADVIRPLDFCADQLMVPRIFGFGKGSRTSAYADWCGCAEGRTGTLYSRPFESEVRVPVDHSHPGYRLDEIERITFRFHLPVVETEIVESDPLR